ncbi:MAG TPA: hypothetical protein VFI46_05510 [Jiangellaceae bacterium]|nr:hypothetical protein [Jiangellaceae bacterium]
MNDIQPPDRPLSDEEADRLLDVVRQEISGLPDFEHLLAAARRQLADLLRPATPQETELVAWLGRELNLQQLLTLAELISYRDAR